MKNMISLEIIEKKILLIRGCRVMLDRDLASMYGVETRVLNQAVIRNLNRFPSDFMITLTKEESVCLVSQNVIPHLKYLGGHSPRAFTEQGVAMLSSVLHSERAIAVNIAIVRAFVKLRELLSTHIDLARKLASLEKKYDAQFKDVFNAIKLLMAEPEEAGGEAKQIGGFKPS